MKLNVPYYSQRDNAVDWFRTCNASSHAMCVEYLKPGLITGDDEYISKLVEYGNTTDHSAHTRMLSSWGIKSEWRTDLDYADLDRQLELGKPIPIGVLHKGNLSNPTGGHICVVIGKNEDGYIVHDPWGEGFEYSNTNGNSVIYPPQSLDKRWLVEGENTGWGRIFS
jgi:hypothetical protein